MSTPASDIAAAGTDRSAPFLASSLGAVLCDAASSSRVWIVAGINEIGRTPKINGAWIFMPNGALAGDYHKHYFVRGFEDAY